MIRNYLTFLRVEVESECSVVPTCSLSSSRKWKSVNSAAGEFFFKSLRRHLSGATLCALKACASFFLKLSILRVL